MGKDKPDIPEQMSENRKIGIAIVIALIIVFSIALLSCLVVCMYQIMQFNLLPDLSCSRSDFYLAFRNTKCNDSYH